MLHILEGHRIPDATFRIRSRGTARDVTTAEIFANKMVIAFGVPGAFTPTCSSTHVPWYEELASTFKRRGIDDIVCISVNDSFVMDAWKRAENADSITFLADGNGSLTEAMGLLVDKTAAGLGRRSRRYSMVVRDGVIERMFVEGPVGDPLEVSDADTMLTFLGGAAPHDIVLVTKPGCEHCARARAMLVEADLPWAELPASPRVLRALPGARTTPQVFVDGRHVGGADDLGAWLGPRPQA